MLLFYSDYKFRKAFENTSVGINDIVLLADSVDDFPELLRRVQKVTL